MTTIIERPAGHLAPETVDAILRAAVQAPSSHNTQPWIFAVTPGVIHLRADRTRGLPVNDPDDRELVMSCGAALFNLRVAAWCTGAAPTIALLPRTPPTAICWPPSGCTAAATRRPTSTG